MNVKHLVSRIMQPISAGNEKGKQANELDEREKKLVEEKIAMLNAGNQVKDHKL